MSCSSQVSTDSPPHPLVLTGSASTVSLSHWTLRSAGYVVTTLSFLLQNLAYEIILTLGQAFEVAYQLALQARKGGHSSTLPESFENKPSKPIPKPRVSIRKSVVSRKDTEVLKTVSGRERGCSPARPLRGVGASENPGPALPALFFGCLPAHVHHPLSPVPGKYGGPSASILKLPRTFHFLCHL